MHIKCPSCQVQLRVDPTKYTQPTIVVQCPDCEQKLRVRLLEKEKAPSPPLQAIVIEESEERATYKKSVSMFRNPYSFKGRIRRTEYGLSLMIFILLISLIQNIFKSLNNDIWYFLDNRVEDTPIRYLLTIPIFILVWFMAAQSAKRCHDIGNSGWFQLIPFYGLILFFKEGQSTPNYYGESVK
jgi:predicted Zn finger-like uncharacterized protein